MLQKTIIKQGSEYITFILMVSDYCKNSELLSNTSTQHRLTKSEIVKGMANRFMYSKFYIGLYLALAFLSFISIVMVTVVELHYIHVLICIQYSP